MATGGGRMINKNRPRPASGVGSGSSSNNVSSGGRNNNSSGGNNKSPTVTTTTSYGGNYLNVDLNTDYQSIINSARDSGDYATAAYNEALRNAKLNYLGRGSEATNIYVSPYTQSVGKNGAGTNGQGGVVYDSNIKSFSDLNDDWKLANINGITYKRDGNNIYNKGSNLGTEQDWRLVGNDVNADTGELYYTNRDDAVKAAYDQYVRSGGGDVGLNYALNNNLIDNGYVNSLMKGTTTAYANDVRSVAEAQRQHELEIEAAARANSFESDFEDDEVAVTPTENNSEYTIVNPYSNYVNNEQRKRRTNIL